MANTNWENLPSTNTPINDENLNKISAGIVNIGTSVDSSYNTNLIHSNNLFDLSYRTFDTQLLSTTNVSLSNGVLTATISSGNAHTGYIIPVEAGKQYTIKWTNATGFNSVQCNGSYPGSSSDLYFRNYNTSDTITITATSNTLFIKLLSSGTAMTITNLMINIGSSALTYEEATPNSIYVNEDKFTETIGVGTNVNSANRVNVLHSKNLYNISNTINASINYSTGAITSETNFRTIYFKCKPNTTYTFSEGIQSNRYVVGFYSSFITTGTLTNITNSATFTSPSTAKYCYIMVSKVSDETSSITDILNSIMINEGSTLLPYEPYVIPSIVADNEEIYNQNIMNYSTNEQVIGKWIDGKPLYRKVYSITSPSSSNTDYEDLTSLNIDRLVHLYGYYKRDTGTFGIPFQDSSENYSVMFLSSANRLRGRIANASGVSDVKVIIEYTKTTD